MSNSMITPAGPQKSPAELHLLARAALQQKNYDVAEQHIDAALSINRKDAIAFSLMADVYDGRNDMPVAAQFMVLAIKADTDNVEHKKKFLRLAGMVAYRRHDPAIEYAILSCLETPTVEFESAPSLWASALVTMKFFREMYWPIFWRDIVSRKFFALKKNPFNSVKDLRPLLYPYFYLGLRKNIFYSLSLERFIIYLRNFLLEQSESSSPRFSAEDYLTLVISVAHYSFRTDYILDITEEEQRKIDALRSRIEAGLTASSDAVSVGLFACYAPLYSLKNAEAIGKSLSGIDYMGGLLREQITEYYSLQHRAATVETLTPITDPTSEKVKEQYEAFPYPRWRELGEGFAFWRKKDKEHLTRPDAAVLIAGCGTGSESSPFAAAFPNVEFLAIDITRASLAYAIDKAEFYDLKNITYQLADILKLDALGRTFDYIQSFGVLHHMEDPEKGWATLVRLLKPGGIMYIGLYSATARRPMSAAHAAIAKGNYPPTAEGMRRFRKDSPKLLSKKYMRKLTQAHDYYSLNMYRHLLFHAHEIQFDIPRIKADLQNMGLTFEGFRVPDNIVAQYTAKFPDDPKGLNLDNWHIFEKANPNIFLACYGFWCSKAA